ncbi:hypothetical protein C8F04DRAFT_714100 [Mycena alexandri]|uniref:Uncharacterized protein n=1 Tax=Mycena alexandri TaxID=1745969 RepID=A0AAD6SQS0_9AGAR|nr:hypothetical protein C8F04DRAFT_714100 [Mycena alexandri]
MFTATEDTELSTRDSDNASCRESAIEFPAHHSRQRESLSTSQETTNFPSTTSSEYKNVQRINTPESTGSSLAATDVPISTFVIYTPDKTTHDRPAVTPEDIKSIENNFTEGGIVLSAHHSTEAEAWVEDHYDDQVFASARSAGLRGPIAVMLSPDVPALAIFGSILDESVLSMGETLADISGFAVMVRPIDDDPVPKFPEPDGSDEPGVTVYTMGPGSKGDEEDNENHDGDQDDKLSDGMRLGDETVAEGRVWRLRGGRGDESDQEDDEIPWFSKAHRAGVWVKLWPDKKRPYDLGLRTTTMFKLQSQYSEEKKMGVQPEVIGHLTLKVETPAKILPDRSYTSLGFLAHRQDSIIERDFIDCGFDQPDQTRKSIDQQSKGATATFNAGYMNLHPTVSAGATYSETRTRTVELADNKPTPRCRIFHDPGQRWNEDGKSYTSYDITTVPGKNPTNGQQHDLEAEYAMGINLLPVENAGLPKISFITRNQVVIWISDPTLKAKVRGLLVLMTTYIPNIRTRKALIVQEELNYHFATSNSPENAPPPPPSAVDAMAVSLSMAPIETQRSRRKSISALFTDVRRKWSANKERTLDLPLQEYISRGWDATNETWRSAVWTSLLDKDFRNTELDKASTSPAWKLRFQPSAKIPEDADLEEVGNDVALDINAGNEPAEVYVVEEVGVAI